MPPRPLYPATVVPSTVVPVRLVVAFCRRHGIFRAMRTLLLLPPMTQVNAPYPATAFLTGFLRSQGRACFQADLAIGLVRRLFSRTGLERVLSRLSDDQEDPAIQHLRANEEDFLATIDPVIRFLQGRDPTLALRISSWKATS